MATPAASLSPKARLNPFCLPSDTGCRFVLLIVIVLAATLFVYNSMSIRGFSAQAQLYKDCLSLQPIAADVLSGLGSPLQVRDASELVAKSTAFSRCVMQAQRRNAEWMLGGVALVGLVTLGIVFLLPTIKIRRGHLVPLLSEDAPEVLSALQSLATQAELREQPTFLWNPLNSAITGLAFGRPRRHCVALSGGLVTKYYTDPDAFRAVVLHEMAHLRNADVDKTYFAVAVWYAFLAAALVPFLITAEGDVISTVAWRLVALTVLVYVARTSVLRIRENYADVRASVWDRPANLRRVITTLDEKNDESSWRRLWRVHPSAADRSRVLENTTPLFNVGFWETLLAGLACGIALPILKLLLATLMTGAVQIGILTSSIFAVLVAGTVGTKMWRASLASIAGQSQTPRILRLALALAAGFVVGWQLSLATAFDGNVLPRSSGAGVFLWNVFALLFLIACLIVFLRWEITSASVWFQSKAAAHSPKKTYLVGRVISAVFLSVILGTLMTAWESGQTYLAAGLPSFLTLALTGLMVSVTQPLLSAVLIALWAFPLAAWFWRSPSDTFPTSWLYLDQPIALPLGSQPRSFFPRTALRFALRGGAIFLVLHLMIRLPWHYTQPSTGSSDFSKLAFYYSQVLLAMLIQVTTATWVAMKVRALPVVHGLFAAFVVGVLSTIIFLGTGLAFGGGLGFKFVADLAQTIVNTGAVASLAVLAAVIWFTREKYATAVLSSEGNI
jgi:hypothetical protein